MEAIISKISIMLVPALLALTLHEVAHGYVAERLGDPTARLLGRLNLNPLRHLDPIGTIAVFVFGFGWARPVPVNAGNLRRPKRDTVWVSLAGPLTNLLLALFSALLLRGVGLLESTSLGQADFFIQIVKPVRMMAGFSLYINVLIGLFNFVPLPPFDGGRVLVGFLSDKKALLMNRLEPFGFILILLLIFFTDLSLLLTPLVDQLVSLLAGSQVGMAELAKPFLFGQ